MLVPKGDVSQNDVGNEVYIEFLNATGVYDVDDNPGGFGGSNPSRNVLAAILVANHKLVAGDVAATVLAYNPLSVESFTVTLPKALNGVLQWNILLMRIYDDAIEGSYVNGDIVYDNENPSAPFIKERVAGVWEVRTAAQVVGKVAVPQANEYSLPISAAIDIQIGLNIDKLEMLPRFVYSTDGGMKEEYNAVVLKYNYVSSLIQGACNAFDKQSYNEAQKMVEEIFNYESKVLVDA